MDHKVSFGAHREFLPSFNSASIAMSAINIDGIADHVILSNDDIFFTNPARPEDFVSDDGTLVVRGKKNGLDMDFRTIWAHQTLNAATIAGVARSEMISPEHCAHAVNLKAVREFLDRNPAHLAANLSHRFRDPSQFTLSSLSIHLALKQGRVRLIDGADQVHIPAANVRYTRMPRLQRRVRRALKGRNIMACFNDLTALLERMPNLRDRLDTRFGVSRAAVDEARRRVA